MGRPVGCKIDLIPVDSACTVTNIDHESVIPADRRMTASRLLYVAKIGDDPTYPDYEGFGSINIITEFGSVKKLRLGRCIRAPTIKTLLPVSGLADKGHECILNKNNPRMITKDGTVVPIYYWNNRFLMPFVVPSDSTHV